MLGASTYLCAEAVPSQELAHWVGAHVDAFEVFGSVPRIVVCDNLRSGVKQANRYEPDINATYQELASRYDLAINPTRAGKPRDQVGTSTRIGPTVLEGAEMHDAASSQASANAQILLEELGRLTEGASRGQTPADCGTALACPGPGRREPMGSPAEACEPRLRHRQKRLTVFVGESDPHGHTPLATEIVQRAHATRTPIPLISAPIVRYPGSVPRLAEVSPLSPPGVAHSGYRAGEALRTHMASTLGMISFFRALRSSSVFEVGTSENGGQMSGMSSPASL